MNKNIQLVLAGIIAAIGLYILSSPVSVARLIAGIIPWLLVGSGVIFLFSLFIRFRRRPLRAIVPGLVGAFLIYAGISMKFGDPRTIGPVGVPFLLSLLLVGGGIAKLISAYTVRNSPYFPIIGATSAITVVMGLLVMFNWSAVSVAFLGVVLGLELLADAAFLASFALHDQDDDRPARR